MNKISHKLIRKVNFCQEKTLWFDGKFAIYYNDFTTPLDLIWIFFNLSLRRLRRLQTRLKTHSFQTWPRPDIAFAIYGSFWTTTGKHYIIDGQLFPSLTSHITIKRSGRNFWINSIHKNRQHVPSSAIIRHRLSSLINHIKYPRGKNLLPSRTLIRFYSVKFPKKLPNKASWLEFFSKY